MFALLLFITIATAQKFLHMSDIHLDLLSDPKHYGPDTFCRSPHNLPEENYLKQTESYLFEDFGKKKSLHYEKIAAMKATTTAAPVDQHHHHSPTPPPNTYYNKKYGWYLCDTTPTMLTEMLNNVFSNLKFDFIVLTGDYAAHNQLGFQSTRDAYSAAHDAVQKANVNNIPVIATVGNEDFYPDYNMTRCSSEQLYHIWESWQYDWIPSYEKSNFLKFGGYRRKFYNDKLRVISINTVMYHTRNRHYEHRQDPCGQFQWLDYELADAAKSGEDVWIMGHIPPTMEFWWPIHQQIFFQLTSKYASVIKSTLWGHTHHDSFIVGDSFYGLVTPSVTPNPPNPSVRVVELSPTYSIVDYAQFYFSLRKANSANSIQLQEEYRFSNAYQLPININGLKTLNNFLISNNSLWDAWNQRNSVYYPDSRYEEICTQTNLDLAGYWKCRMDKTM